MYIPEFWVGFVVGVITELVVLIALPFWLDRKKK